jgi:hypothetical protein
MKKQLSKSAKALALSVMVLVGMVSFSSCEKTNIIENYYPNPNKSFIYSISTNQWVDNGNQIYHTLNLPELTSYYIQQGGVSVAMSFDNEQSYDILPATFNGVAYSVRYSLGKVTIYAEDPINDPNILVPIPNKVMVKVILSETDFVE